MRPPHPVQHCVATFGAPPKAPVGVSACVCHTQCHGSWPHTELHRRPQCGCPHASAKTSTTFRGHRGSSTEGPNGGARMRPPQPVQRFVAPYGAPPKAPVWMPACVRHT
eukprot:1892218-Pyramimonas_sp.AAC.1